MSLNYEFDVKGNVLILRLAGELDHHAAEPLREKVAALIDNADIKNLILNLEKLEFMDSSGLGVILGRYNQIKKREGELIICSVSPIINELLRMSGILKIVKLEETEKTSLLRLGVSKSE